MSPDVTRRAFLEKSAAAVTGGVMAGAIRLQSAHAQNAGPPAPAKRPVIIASANGRNAVARAMWELKAGADPLDAVVAGVQLLEDDENDMTVGKGGLPNEAGVVQLDASVMHGPSRRAGAVAALEDICHAAAVAQKVMQRTDHVLIVGAGAKAFAKAHGFKEENLLTEQARETWLKWKEHLSKDDDWLPPPDAEVRGAMAPNGKPVRTWGTVNCLAVTATGDIAGVTTTSGLAYKIPGRVGDSPIIGAGLFVDNDVGAAGSTGRGEANLLNCSSAMIVEFMRRGMAPFEACLEMLQRVADKCEPRLRDDKGRPEFDLKFYAVNKNGLHGSASMWSGGLYAVHDGGDEARRDKAQFLFERK
jgi:N4-(beta-N-acetylglucosaminyl)-L-asparaginase